MRTQHDVLSLDEAKPPRPRRRSRFGLYAPVLLLLVLVGGWSAAWIVIREQARSGLDDWISGEAAAGRRWTCADRRFGGYPFRIEIHCSDFVLDRPDMHISIGRLAVVSQIYRPRHIIAEASGPLRVQAPQTRIEGDWRLLQASVMLRDRGFDRISLVVDNTTASVQSPGQLTLDTAARRFEAHLRPDPDKATAYDLALKSEGAVIPGLDALVGGEEPADLLVNVVVTEADDLPARPLWSELERWRLANGRVELKGANLTKGSRRAEASGTFGIDADHRVQGQLQAAGAGLGGLLGRLAEGSGVTGALIGALLGTPEPGSGPATGGSGLKPLPPLRLERGRLFVGPFQIPGFRLPPLY